MEETIKRQRALTLVKRMETPGWFKIAVPVASIIGGFLFSAIFLMAAGESPIRVYSVMFGGGDRGENDSPDDRFRGRVLCL